VAFVEWVQSFAGYLTTLHQLFSLYRLYNRYFGVRSNSVLFFGPAVVFGPRPLWEDVLSYSALY